MTMLATGTAPVFTVWGGCEERVSANPTAGRGLIQESQGGDWVQHDSVASVGLTLESLLSKAHLSTAQFGKNFLMIMNSIPCAQQS